MVLAQDEQAGRKMNQMSGYDTFSAWKVVRYLKRIVLTFINAESAALATPQNNLNHTAIPTTKTSTPMWTKLIILLKNVKLDPCSSWRNWSDPSISRSYSSVHEIPATEHIQHTSTEHHPRWIWYSEFWAHPNTITEYDRTVTISTRSPQMIAWNTFPWYGPF